jgi:hypothetical protein
MLFSNMSPHMSHNIGRGGETETFNVDNRWENAGLKSLFRKARIDSTGALHHIVIRGIEGKATMFDFVNLEAIDFHPRCRQPKILQL